jgi:hypothetical protein
MQYYQESLLHAAACGVGEFLYFNPMEFGHISLAQHDILQDVGSTECPTF